MNLYGIIIENYKKIRGAQLEFDGQHLIQVRGKNGAGKSSVIEAIERLFKGGSAPGVVTHGEKKALIIGTFGDFTATKSIDADGKAVLSVKKEGHGVVQAAQSFMDQIAGQFIDPVWFAELPGKEARTNLIKYSGIDFTTIDAKIAQKEQTRTDIGRDVKRVGNPTPCAKVQPVSVTDLANERKAIEEFNKEQDLKAGVIMSLINNVRNGMINELSLMLKTTDEPVIQFVKCFDKLTKDFNQSLAQANALSKPETKHSTAAIDEKLKKADEINLKAANYTAYIAAKKKRDDLDDEYKKLTEEIKILRAEKSELLKSANLPLPGLDITDDNLTLNGTLYDTLSTSERLKVALVLAVHFSGELKTVFIRRGECMDAESLAKLKEFAEAKDFQIIMEIVDSSYSVTGDGVFQIKDGEVIGVING